MTDLAPVEPRDMPASPPSPPVRVKDEPLTYHRHAPYSYFRDLMLTDRTAGARQRLARHAQEMEVVRKESERRAWQAIHAGDIEYRVEPSRTAGQGGYFAPPLWLNQYFATANRPGRVLAGLIPAKFPLPAGVSSINLPILSTGTATGAVADVAAVPDQDIADAAGTSTVATIAGDEDVAVQLLEQSPAGAHLDWALFQDLCEDYDAKLEGQLLSGAGSASSQLTGVTQVASIVTVTYTDGSPTGHAMWPYFAQAVAKLADGRQLPPEVWLVRTARWAWLMGQEDTSNRPFGIPSPFFMGAKPDQPDPVGGLISVPVFCDDAIPATLGAGANQDQAVVCRPSDLMLLEGEPQTAIIRDYGGSGSLTVRIQLRNYVAAITNRHAAGIATVGGTGFAVDTAY